MHVFICISTTSIGLHVSVLALTLYEAKLKYLTNKNFDTTEFEPAALSLNGMLLTTKPYVDTYFAARSIFYVNSKSMLFIYYYNKSVGDLLEYIFNSLKIFNL